jgi:hypothetical protein
MLFNRIVLDSLEKLTKVSNSKYMAPRVGKTRTYF